MLGKLYNDIVNGQNSADSLFMPDFNLSNISPPFSFQSNFNCDYQIPPNISQSNFPLIDGQILSDNGPRNDFNGKYSNIGFNTVFAEKSYGKHSLFIKYDYNMLNCNLYLHFIFISKSVEIKFRT